MAMPQRERESEETSALQRSLRSVAEAAQSINTRDFELAPRESVLAKLVPLLREVLDDAITVLGQTLAWYEAPSAIDTADDSAMFNLVFDDMVDDIVDDPCPADPRQRIADIAFMARWEVERKRSALGEAMQGEDARLIAECCSVRRRVVKATSGVERVLAATEGQPTVFASLFQTERQRAIETRSAYYVFALRIQASADVWQTRDLLRCIRLIGASMAQLVGRPIYEDLRFEDRKSLRSLQIRLIDWLRGEQDAREGQRLISELMAFTSLLMAVNRRPVLIEYDCEVLAKLIAALAQPATDAKVFHRLLSTLRGREPEIDRLIERQADLHPDLWLDIAQRTLARLREQASASPTSAAESSELFDG